MSIANTNRVSGPYSGNGSATQFPFDFKVFQASEVRVVRTDTSGAESDLALGTDYTVALNANQDANPGGTVTVTAPLAVGYLLTLTSQVQNLQPVTLTNNGGFYPRVINDALDRLTILAQQIAENLGRALKFPISDGSVNSTLPSRSNRKGRVLAFHETTGDPVQGPSVADVGTVGANVAAINTVSSNLNGSNTIGTVAGSIGSVNTVGNNIAAVSTVASNVSNVNTVAGNIAKVATVANNLADVTNFADVYLGPRSSNPSTRTDGSALVTGDMYFNTNTNRMMAYASGVWYATDTLGATDAALVTWNTTSVANAIRQAFSRTGIGWLLSNRRLSNHLSGITGVRTNDAPTISTGSLVPSNTDFVSSDLVGPSSPISTVALVNLGATRKVVVTTTYPHGLSTNDKVLIAGTFNNANYYGTRVVTVTDKTTFEWNIGVAYPPAPTYTSPTWQLYGYMTGPQHPAFTYSLPRDKMTTANTPSWSFGAYDYRAPGVKSQGSALNYSVEFMLEDSVMEIYMNGGASNTANHRVWVDGALISDTMKGGSSSSSYPGSMTRYTWAKSKLRHIRIEFYRYCGFFGVGSLNRYAVKVSPYTKPRALIIGDSFVEGTGQYTAFMGLVDFLAYKLGWNIINMGSGSTGITTNGVAGRYKYIDRLNEDVIPYKPDVVLVWGSVNDGASITTANAGALFDAISNALPNTKIIAFGPCSSSENVYSGPVTSGTNLKAACDARGIPYIDGGIGVGGAPAWLTSSNVKAYYLGTQATATATASGGAVTAVAVGTQGDGYEWRSVPAVSFSGGGGTGAAATANMETYVVDIVVLNGGRGYTVAPTVTLTNGATAALNWANHSGGFVNGLNVLNGGDGYTTPPTVVISGGGGSGAAGYAEIAGGKVVNLVLTNGGTGYTSAPTVTLVDNPNATAQPTATANLTNGAVSSITITNPGASLSNTPCVVFSGGDGTGAEAVAFLTSRVKTITVTNGGSGYTSAPTVTIPHPTGGDPTHPKTTGHQMLAARIASQIERLG